MHHSDKGNRASTNQAGITAAPSDVADLGATATAGLHLQSSGADDLEDFLQCPDKPQQTNKEERDAEMSCHLASTTHGAQIPIVIVRCQLLFHAETTVIKDQMSCGIPEQKHTTHRDKNRRPPLCKETGL